jgi:hypothetical protein
MNRRAFLVSCGAGLALAQEKPRDLELFLLIGQSNMAGRGVVEAQDKEVIPGVWMLTKELTWAPAVDPLHFDKPQVAGVGIGRTFAQTLLKWRPGASIGLIPAAFGGTSLDEWKPGGKLYTDAVARAKEGVKSGRLRGILWHQGEADSGSAEKIASYRESFAAMVARLREDLSAADVPVVVGELGEYRTTPLNRQMNEQLALVQFSVPRSGFVSSAGLVHKGDGTHFDSPSLREFGRRYALAYMALDKDWARVKGN